jgi:SDR family mycofactocin-dependent oxidoreductase
MSRVAIVTGAGRGIGAATVAALAADGWRVLAVDRADDDPRLPYPMASADDLRASVAGANATAPDGASADPVRAAVADATDEAAMAVVVEAAEEWGGLEAIVADAGVIAGGVPAWELPIERQRAVMEVCLDGVMVAARVAIPALLRRPQPRRGRFVAVSSAAAFRGLPGLAAYCAAKAGVGGFVRGLAVDLRDTGITANAIAPGSTDTPILDESARLYDLDSAADFAPQQPLGRLLEPGEPAAMIAWLLGPQAAAVTGALLPVDGGLAV